MIKRTPSYCRHKATGQAVVRLDGKDFYLGRYGSSESEARYKQLIAEWLSNAKTAPHTGTANAPSLTVAELLLRYWRWAEDHYRDPDGNPSRELGNLRDALRPLRLLYAHSPAREFGPLALRAVQDAMVEQGLCRNVINWRVNRVRRLFKWAASFELVPASVYQSLRTVDGLRRGRARVKESKPVGPVQVERVEATLPFLLPPVAAMVRLQLLTGCRAGEVVVMRGRDIDTSGEVWAYRPHRHKNRHRGKERVVYLGPLAQEVLRPFLKDDPDAYVFCPRRYVEEMHARRAAARRTKRTPSELKRQRKDRPKVRPTERYQRSSYRQAVVRACDRAFPLPDHLAPRRLEDGKQETMKAWWARLTSAERDTVRAWRRQHRWHPLQLRHTAATLLRAKYGLEATRTVLGHSRVETSQIYAEKDAGLAQRIMGEVG